MSWSYFFKHLLNCITGGGHDLDELARRLGVNTFELENLNISYHKFTIPKRSGGSRQITAPDPGLKKMQRCILRRLLAKLKVHPDVTGFVRGHSIVSNARAHVGTDLVIRMDIKDFFGTCKARRVKKYFRRIGWDRKTSRLLTDICTYDGSLPQGAPTSPMLSNLINYRMDARLSGLARCIGGVYTRYADDLTFSFLKETITSRKIAIAQNPKTLEKIYLDPNRRRNYHRVISSRLIWSVRVILEKYGYQIHTKRKLFVRRRSQQQKVTGLIVNEKVNLPRQTRRRLRAIRHHIQTGRNATLTPEQLAGWDALENMIHNGRSNLKANVDKN